jgi:hypothetical protein
MWKAFVLVLLCGVGWAKSVTIWEYGKVISQETGSSAGGAAAIPIGNIVVAAPIYRTWSIVEIQAGDYIYQWQEQPSHRGHIVFPVNSEIRFWRKGKWFMTLDAAGRQHRFGLIHAVLSTSPASASPR